MKKLLLLALLLCGFMQAMAYEWTDDNGIVWTFYVSYTNATDIRPADRSAILGDVEIPSTVYSGEKELIVTSIGDGAFQNCSGLTSVSIPESVTSIGAKAFDGCTGLTKVIVPDIVAWCNISFSGSSSNPISYAKHIYSDENTEIKDLVIPSSVTSIRDAVFYGCTGLTSVTIPESVTSISSSAFSGCTNLTVKVPVTDMAAFCNNTIVGMIKSAIGKPVTLFDGEGNEITSYVIPDGVEAIGNYAFYNCTVMSVSIPSSVTSIGQYAFCLCYELRSVTIPSGVTSIGQYAFSSCSSIKRIDIPFSVIDIGNYAFYNCSDLKRVTISEGVTSIGNYAFQGCSGLTSVTINSNAILSREYTTSFSIKNIFGNQVNSYILGEGVTSIGQYTFYDCSGLTSVTIPEGVTSIGSSAFRGCTGLTSVTIPEGVTSIGSEAFWSCTGMTSVTIPEGVTYIGEDAFYNCSGLTSVTIPSSVTSIGNGAFEECYSLTSVTISEGVTSIGSEAFRGCTGLKSLTLPASVTSINSSAFLYCTNLKTVKVPVTDMATFCNNKVTGLIKSTFNKPVTLIDGEGNEIMDIEIPDGVESISANAFYNCTGLTSVTIPESVSSIGSQAFVGCKGLTNVFIRTKFKIYRSLFIGGTSCLTNATLYVRFGMKGYYDSIFSEDEVKDVIEWEPVTDYGSLDNTLYTERMDAAPGGQVKLSVKMKNTVPIQGYQFDLQLPPGISVATDADGFPKVELSTARTTTRRTDYFNPQILDNGDLRVLCGSTKGYTFSGNDGEVAIVTLDISIDVGEDDYCLFLKEIGLSDSDNNSYDQDLMASTLAVRFIPGDVNGDTFVDVSDFIGVADYILGFPPSIFLYKAANVNNDDKINVADFTGIANIILNSMGRNAAPPRMKMMAAPRKNATDIEALDNAIYVEPLTAVPGTQQVLSVRMKNSIPVAGFEFCLQLPEGITVAVDEDGFPLAELSDERTTHRRTNYFNSNILPDGTLKLLCGTSAGNPTTGKPWIFEGNEGEVAHIIVNIPDYNVGGVYEASVAGAVISDAEANGLNLDNTAIKIMLTEETTDISSPAIATMCEGGKWYTIDGRKLDIKPTLKGVYILDGKKVVIKN